MYASAIGPDTSIALAIAAAIDLPLSCNRAIVSNYSWATLKHRW
jgi:hypothetical protein